jgi:hypothetical protein
MQVIARLSSTAVDFLISFNGRAVVISPTGSSTPATTRPVQPAHGGRDTTTLATS